MPIHLNGFTRISIDGVKLVSEGKHQLAHIETSHSLMQAAGYIKHIVASKGIYGVYFRGQHHLYSALQPSLYRGVKTAATASTHNHAINELFSKIRQEKKVLRDIDEQTIEPLLQHYGFKTRWLDVVDNIWIALWFACFEARCWGHYNEYLHFQRRDPEKEPEDKRYAYILLISVSHNKARKYKPGISGNNHSEVIDLRYAAPSYFLRPHSQHGLLVRQKDTQNGTALDFSDLIEGVLRISLSDALAWLGQGKTFDVHSLFPPPNYDTGYRQMLQLKEHENSTIGSIHHIGA